MVFVSDAGSGVRSAVGSVAGSDELGELDMIEIIDGLSDLRNDYSVGQW